MKIAVNTRFLLKNRLEGIGLFTYEVARRLVEAHPSDDFFFFFDRPHDPGFVFGKNVTPVVLFPPARHPFLFVWWFEWSVARALKRYDIDVFLSPDNFLSLTTPVRTVLVTHDLAHVHFPGHLPLAHRLYYRFLVPKFNRRAAQVVAVSGFTKNDLVAQYGISPAKIAVACNGCRPFFTPLPAPAKQAVRERFSEGKPYFFYMGAVHPRKNVHRLIAAFDRFKTATGADSKLLIAGRFAWQVGEVKAAYQAAAHRQDVHFLGYVTDEDGAQLMAAALACTYVSLFEGFGVPVLEAMHCEVPVITSRAASLPEVAGDAGLLVDPFSIEEIAGAMHQVWADPHLCKEMVERGKQQRQHFSWEKAAAVVWDSLMGH